MEFLVNENIIQVDVSQTSETSQGVPDWVKNTAGWWAINAISETEFVNAIAYLIESGIISIESTKSPELIAKMWVNGDINDDEFLTDVEQMIENNIITVQSDSITKMSDLPDWLVNNAGWWTARILTKSDFDFDPGYVKERIFPCEDDSRSGIVFNQPSRVCLDPTYNSHGFRGDEFEREKLDNVFRIFTVGGSTTFGEGTQNSETWPVQLQQIIDEKITDQEIEVINAGIAGGDTETEYGLIKNKISSFDPDLIIMYDGWNDSNHHDVKKTIQNWGLVCKLGQDEGFDTIIIVQPLPITGQRVLTEQEIVNSFLNLLYLQKSQQYVDAFKELDKICTKTADFRGIFDYTQEPIFMDDGHTMSFGNKIIAENIFSVISPNIGKTYSVIHSDLSSGNSESGTGIVYAVGADLSGRNFDNLNLQNAVFDKANLSNTSFKNANIDGARFVYANLDNSDLLDRTDLSNINLAGTDLSNVSLKGKDLSGTMLTSADLSGAILTGADLSGAILTGADLSGKDFTGAILTGVDLSNMDLTEVIFTDVDLSGLDLNSSNLSGIDLSGKDLTGAIFDHANFADANLENINLTKASFADVDFTKIKNKSLAGADLSGALFSYSDLSGVDLSGAIIHASNFWNADILGVDFTVTHIITDGVIFVGTNLSNSNFEGIDLAPKEPYFQIFKNRADLKNLDGHDLTKELFGLNYNILITSKEVQGNDLAVNYVFFNNFTNANLENTNFKNADLRNTRFYSATLTNVDLSGADLRNAFFGYADLSNANLTDANLQGALLDNAILSNANLKCLNHPICNN